MENIVQTLFCALLSESTDKSPFDTDATKKAFYNAYDKWVEMAEIEGDLDAQDDAFKSLVELESVDRMQAFKVGLYAAFKMFMELQK